MRKLFPYLIALAVVLGVASTARAQTTVTSTTTTAAISTTNPTTITLASTTGLVVGNLIVIDREAMVVNAIPTTTTVQVRRGTNGTPASLHASGVTAYYGPPNYFKTVSPNGGAGGACTLSATDVTPWINIDNGRIWQCIGGQWLSVVDAFAWVGPGNCTYSTNGGTLATPAAVTNVGVYEVKSNGLINAGATAPATPMMQIATTNGGTAINTITCQIPVPTRANLSRGVYVVDATWTYGVQQTTLNATQVATLASGLLNGVAVFTKVAFPAAGATETPSTVTPVRWDSGTLAITPALLSGNVATINVGQFYTAKMIPATPIAMTTDMTAYFTNLTVLCTATSATSVNTAGVLVHYAYVDF